MPTAPPPEHLQRAIGPRALALTTVNCMVGSGIFVLPALVAEGLGAAAILAYLVCGALVFMIGLCFAELGSGTTSSGGPYAYIGKAFGPFAGFLASNIYWFGGSILSDTAISNALADILAGFFPAMSSGIYRVVFIVILFVLLAAINIRSVKHGLRFVEFATLTKLIPLIILVILATRFVDPGNLRWTVAPEWGGLGSASLLLFFAFVGLETPLINGGEIKDPRRTVPRGLLLGLVFVLLLYISIQLITQGVLGADLLVYKASPLGAVAGIVIGAAGLVAVTLVSFVSMTGAMAGDMLSTPRILYAAGLDGSMPRALGRVHPSFATPHMAIFIYALAGCTIAVTGNFRMLAILSSASVLTIYLGVVLAVLKKRFRPGGAVVDAFRAPGGAFLPIVASCGIIWLLSHLAKDELIGMSAFLLILSVLYGISFLLKKRSARKALALQPV